MQLIRPALFISVLFLSLLSSAQVIVNDKDNEYDKKYTPVQNSIFNNLNKKNTQNSSSSNIEIKNSIKFCPTMILREKIVFFYEREITKGLSVNIGLGKAFGVDVIQNVFFETFSEQGEPRTLTPGSLLSNSQYTASSPYVSLGLKLYYSGNSFDGGYVNLNYMFERTDYTLSQAISGETVEGSRDFSFKMNAFNFGFGHTFVGGRKNNVTHELYFNCGIKLFTYSKYDEVEVPSNNYPGSTETVYRRSTQELDARILPSFSMGYVFGFGF